MDNAIFKDSLRNWAATTIETDLYRRYDSSEDFQKLFLEVYPIDNDGWVVNKFYTPPLNTSSYHAHDSFNKVAADSFVMSSEDYVLRKLDRIMYVEDSAKLIKTSAGHHVGRFPALKRIETCFDEQFKSVAIFLRINVEDDLTDFNVHSFLKMMGVPEFLPQTVIAGGKGHVGVRPFQDYWIFAVVPENCVENITYVISSLRHPRWKHGQFNRRRWALKTMPASSSMELRNYQGRYTFDKFYENWTETLHDEMSIMLWGETVSAFNNDDYGWNRDHYRKHMLNLFESFVANI